VHAAGRRGECALGVRRLADAHDDDRSFGASINPPKATPLTLAADDQVIVVADHR